MTREGGSLEIHGPMSGGYDRILATEALRFLEDLTHRFRPRLHQLLEARRGAQARLDAGERLDFLPETAAIRASEWKVAPAPADLQDRRVEITGPVDRKMIINALNSGASCFMADFEDANSPTWDNLLQGHLNLCDAVAGTIAYDDPQSGKHYELQGRPATLIVRPRGLHLPEQHVWLDGEPVPGCLFDFGLYVFHNAKALLAKGTGPYFYIPKLESHLEARWWSEVFGRAEELLDIGRGKVKATVLIETLPAAFEMDEILYELREHCVGLNCGRWDYIFSFIKKQRTDPAHVVPDRYQVTMTQPCMRAYTQLVVKTCHRRGAHAMGGMAAQIPIKDDPAANEAAMEKVRADKLREVNDGHDGTWVAHPALVPIAKEIFDSGMPGPNQLGRLREDVQVTAADLLAVPTGSRTDEGLRNNLRVGVQYLEAWLRGYGAVPLYDLMEDAATAEIARTQVWQWLHHAAEVGGEPLTRARFLSTLEEEMRRVRAEVGDERFAGGRFGQARRIFEQLCLAEQLPEFLTLPAYQQLLANEAEGS